MTFNATIHRIHNIMTSAVEQKMIFLHNLLCGNNGIANDYTVSRETVVKNVKSFLLESIGVIFFMIHTVTYVPSQEDIPVTYLDKYSYFGS